MFTIWDLLIAIWVGGALGFGAGAAWRASIRPTKYWQHSFLSGMLSLFHEGEVARQRGEPLCENPYKPGTPEQRSWSFGWCWSKNRE